MTNRKKHILNLHTNSFNISNKWPEDARQAKTIVVQPTQEGLDKVKTLLIIKFL